MSGSKLEAVNPDGTRAFTVQPYGKTARAGFNVAVGEVAADGGADVFVHISAVERAGLGSLSEGQKVSFEIERDRRTGKSAAGQLQAV